MVLRCYHGLSAVEQSFATVSPPSGRLAQLVRAPALQAGSPGFESLTAHHPSMLRNPLSEKAFPGIYVTY